MFFKHVSPHPQTLECALKKAHNDNHDHKQHNVPYELYAGKTSIKARLSPMITSCAECLGSCLYHDETTGQSRYCVEPAPQHIVSIYNTSELPLRYLHAHFDSKTHGFRNYSGNADQVLSQIHHILNSIPKKHETLRDSSPSTTAPHKGVILSGPVGVGKTFLAVCMAKNFIEKGYGVRFMDFFRISSEIQAQLIRKQSALDILDPLIDVDVLIIDELGKGRNSEFELTIIDQIIMGRYNQNKPTIATTNYQLRSSSTVDLKSSASAFESDTFGSLKDRVGSRIFSRLTEGTQFIELCGHDYRSMMNKQPIQRPHH